MTLSEQLIDQYGPIIIVLLLAYNVVPSLVSKVMESYTRSAQAHATVTEGPYMITKTVLETSAKERERHDEVIETFAQELIGLRAKVDTKFDQLNKKIDDVLAYLKGNTP